MFRGGPQRAIPGVEVGDGIPQAHRDPMLCQPVPHRGGDLGIQGRHELGRLFHHGHRQPAVDQVFRHLQTDEAAADDQCGFRLVVGDPGPDPAGIRDGSHRENPRQVDPGDGRTDGRRPGGQDQGVVGFLLDLAGGQIAHRQQMALPIDGQGLVAGPHLDVEAIPEQLGAGHQQLPFVGDHVPHKIG